MPLSTIGPGSVTGGGPKFDIVSLGECLVEFNRRDDGSFDPGFAGDAFNALFYAGRLGARAGFISAVGDDLFTPMILGGIEREGIDISQVLRLERRRNGLYFIELDAGGEYTFHFWRERSAATATLLHHQLDPLADYITGARIFLITGVTLAVMEGPERLLRLLELVRADGGTRVALDTNYRRRLWSSPEAYRERFETILPFADILLPTRADLEEVYGAGPIEPMLRELAAAGPGLIAMKCGADGCALLTDGELRRYPAPERITPVDTTGAGDAFNAGFLTALLEGRSHEECCAVGQRVAARALRVRGALDHTITRSGLGL